MNKDDEDNEDNDEDEYEDHSTSTCLHNQCSPEIYQWIVINVNRQCIIFGTKVSVKFCISVLRCDYCEGIVFSF